MKNNKKSEKYSAIQKNKAQNTVNSFKLILLKRVKSMLIIIFVAGLLAVMMHMMYRSNQSKIEATHDALLSQAANPIEGEILFCRDLAKDKDTYYSLVKFRTYENDSNENDSNKNDSNENDSNKIETTSETDVTLEAESYTDRYIVIKNDGSFISTDTKDGDSEIESAIDDSENYCDMTAILENGVVDEMLDYKENGNESVTTHTVEELVEDYGLDNVDCIDSSDLLYSYNITAAGTGFVFKFIAVFVIAIISVSINFFVMAVQMFKFSLESRKL